MSKYYAVLAVIALGLLAGCGGQPEKKSIYRPAVVAEQPKLPPREQISAWLEEAETAESPRQQQLQLFAVDLLLQERQPALAEELLNSVNVAFLNDPLTVQAALLRARVHRAFGEYDRGLAWLTDPNIVTLLQESEESIQLYASEQRATLYALQGAHVQAAQERIYIDPFLPAYDQVQNREKIWNSLTRANISDLAAQRQSASNVDYQGWLELAAIAQDNQGNLDAQLQQLEDWRARWAGHPVANQLPGGLDAITQLASERPQQIAILLPVSGRLASYGKAIRDGFMAAWFENKGMSGTVPVVKSYDTADQDVTQLYQRAVAEGAELVIGPLDKAQVERLAMSEMAAVGLPVPVLAMNRIEGQNFPKNFYQFGLDPGDEAAQIANIAAAEGHKRALILVPEGAWGRKVSSDFTQRWEAFGNEVVSVRAFSGRDRNYGAVIPSVLNINDSKERYTRLRQLSGKKFEFQPRRRTDFDCIFLLARPQEARAVKPLLAYHYAGDVPVYSTSHVYSGDISPSKNRDVNDVKFVEIPWVLDGDNELKKSLTRNFRRGGSWQRMYALGVDSYRLYSRLPQLQGLNSQVYGETGKLRMNPLGQIERELLLAQFQEGRATEIPMVDTLEGGAIRTTANVEK